MGGDAMKKVLIDKHSGEIYFSPCVGQLMMLSAAMRNEGLLLVTGDEFEDTHEARKVSLNIAEYDKTCGAFFQVVIEERGAVVYAESHSSYWKALESWYQWGCFWDGLAQKFFTEVVRTNEITDS